MRKYQPQKNIRKRKEAFEKNLIHIAICDDDLRVVKNIQSILENYKSSLFTRKEYQLYIFNSAEKLLKAMQIRAYDLVFLDIEMSEMSGFKAAENLRMNYPKTEIVFVTEYENLVYQSFNFRPFRFIRKAYLKEELGIAVDDYYREYVMSDYCEFGQLHRRIRISEIQYIEVYNHDLIVHYRDGIMKFRGSLARYEKELVPYGFVKPNRSYLVNMAYILNFDGKEIVVNDEWKTKLMISQRKQSEVVKLIQEYKDRRKLRI